MYRNMSWCMPLALQGVFPPGSYWNLGLPDNWYGTLEWQYPPDQRMGAYEEEGRAVNHIKAGIITADRIVTVRAQPQEACVGYGVVEGEKGLRVWSAMSGRALTVRPCELRLRESAWTRICIRQILLGTSGLGRAVLQ